MKEVAKPKSKGIRKGPTPERTVRCPACKEVWNSETQTEAFCWNTKLTTTLEEL